MSRRLAVAAGAIIGSVFGFAIGHYTRDARHPPLQPVTEHSQPTDSASAPEVPGGITTRQAPSFATIAPDSTSSFETLRSLTERVTEADGDQLDLLIDEALAYTNFRTRDLALQLAFARLAEVEPRTALARARALEPSVAATLVPFVIGAWSANDVDAAMDAALLIEPAKSRTDAAREILLSRNDLDAPTRRRIARTLAGPGRVELMLLETQAARASPKALGRSPRRRTTRIDAGATMR